MNKDILKLASEVENILEPIYKDIDKDAFYNSQKVLNAFKNNNVTESDFASTTGYGYGDIGRDKIEKVFAEVLGAEDALVRNQIISGTHALTICLFSILRPNDNILFISGEPYDTLHEVIGIKDNNSSLKSFGINYDIIDLKNNDFDYEKINNFISKKIYKVIYIQRSKGYSTRESINIEKIEKVIKNIRKINNDSIIMIDNCYCEMVERVTPLEVGADVIVGSLIKNLGGGIASNGGYIAGKKEYVHLASERLTVPGEAKEVGPSLNMNKSFLQGLYYSPSAVASSLKTAIFTSLMMEKLGFMVSPKYNEKRCDIVQNIIFNDEEKLIKYVSGIQNGSAIDSNFSVIPSNMPGYEDKIVMASGSFTQGSSIEISCDGPLRKPYIAYQQGSLTYEYGKLAVINAINNLLK